MPDENVIESPTPAATAPAETPATAATETPAETPRPSTTGLGFEEFLAGAEGSPDPSPAADDTAEPADDDAADADATTDAAPPAADGTDAAPSAAAARDWDSDDNPWKGKTAELEKRVKDTRDSYTQVNQQLAEIKRQNEILEKKVDGTYDPAKDGLPDPDQIATEVRQREVTQARARASVEAAKRLYGEEALHKAIFAEDAPFRLIEQNEPAIAAAILASDAPAIAAMELLETRRFEARWGKTPKDIETAIRADERAAAEREFTERLAKRNAERDAKRQAQPRGVADARGGGVPASANKGHSMPSLAELGNRGFA